MGHTPLLDLLDEHSATCPRCQAREAAFLITPEHEGLWKCATCGLIWHADEHVSALLGTAPKTIH